MSKKQPKAAPTQAEKKNDRKRDAFNKANVALLFMTPAERECVIKAVAIIYGVSL